MERTPTDTAPGTITGDVTAGAVHRLRRSWKRLVAVIIAGSAVLLSTCVACTSQTEAVADTVAGALGYEPAGTADLADVAAELGRQVDVLAPRARAEARADAAEARAAAQAQRVAGLEARIEQLQNDHTMVLGAVHVDYQLEIDRLVAELAEAHAFIALFPAEIVAAIMAQQALPVDESAPAPTQ